jgi:hypothetical protein
MLGGKVLVAVEVGVLRGVVVLVGVISAGRETGFVGTGARVA